MEAQTLTCPECGKQLRLPEKLTKVKQVRCPLCNSTFSAVPSTSCSEGVGNGKRAASRRPAAATPQGAVTGSFHLSAAGVPGLPGSPPTTWEDKAESSIIEPATMTFLGHERPTESDERSMPPGYEYLEELGRGGMGVVYKARHARLERVVAVKMILGGAHAGAAHFERFRVEAQAVARLQHPNIVQIHEIGEHQGLPYFTLEFCNSGSLARAIDNMPQEARPSAALVEKLARAIHFAHEKNIIHRDLKPANVLLARGHVPPLESSCPFAQADPKITDFGLAKKLDEADQTLSGAVMGTPSYMAPEQAAGDTKAIGPLADVYALGAVLYELLTGRPPFRAANKFDTIVQVMTKEPIAPAQLNPKTPTDLETICLKCLAKDRHKRYESALELADDLARFQAGEPIRARPVGSFERAWRWCRRNRLVAALLAAVAVTLLTGTVVASMFAVAAAASAERARENERKADDNARREMSARQNAEKAEAQARKAADAAKLAESAARSEAHQRKLVADYLQNLFVTSDPLGLTGYGFRAGDETGQKLTAEEVVKRGAGKILHSLQDQPATQAAIMDVIGSVLRNLGQFNESGELLKKAYAQRLKLFSPDHPEVATSLHNLGWWYHDKGDYLQAGKHYRLALEARRKHLPADDPLVAETLFHLAWLEAQIGDDVEAEKLYQQVIDIRIKRYGRQHREVALAQVGLAGVCLNQRNALRAMVLMKEALDTFKKQDGDRGITVGLVLFQEGFFAQTMNDHHLAVKKLREARSYSQRLLGKNHIYEGVILYHLGGSLDQIGNFTEAEYAYRDCLDVLRKTVGFEHPKSDVLIRDMISFLQRRGKKTEARELADEFLRRRLQTFGNDSQFVARALEVNANFAWHDLRDFPRADTLYRQAIAIFRKGDATAFESYSKALNDFGLILADVDRADEAEQMFREALTLEKNAKDKQSAARLTSNLAFALRLQNKLDEAERLYRECLPHFATIFYDRSRALAVLGLGETLRRRGSLPEAEKYLRDAMNLAKGKANERFIVELSLEELAELHLHRGEYALAQHCFQELLNPGRSTTSAATTKWHERQAVRAARERPLSAAFHLEQVAYLDPWRSKRWLDAGHEWRKQKNLTRAVLMYTKLAAFAAPEASPLPYVAAQALPYWSADSAVNEQTPLNTLHFRFRQAEVAGNWAVAAHHMDLLAKLACWDASQNLHTAQFWLRAGEPMRALVPWLLANLGNNGQASGPLWTHAFPVRGHWGVVDDQLFQQARTPNLDALLFVGDPSWTNVDISVDVLADPHDAAVCFRAQPDHFLFVTLGGWQNSGHGLIKRVNGKEMLIKKTAGTIVPGQWHRLSIEARGDDFKVSLNGQPIFQERIEGFPRGGIGFRTFGSSARYRNLRVVDSQGAVLFTGLPIVHAAPAPPTAVPKKTTPLPRATTPALKTNPPFIRQVGSLGLQDVKDTNGKYRKTYLVQLTGQKTYVIDLKKGADKKLDPYLMVYSQDGKLLAQDDDSGGNLDSRIAFTPVTTGQYRLVVTSFSAGMVGDFALSVATLAGPLPPSQPAQRQDTPPRNVERK